MYIDHRVLGSTKLTGIIGNPVEHSISPQLHNSISFYLGLNLIYVPFKVEKNELENAVRGLKALNIAGFNVTVPYKKDIMKFIDENSKEAILVGAVNTVKNINGRLYGYNTDAEGFARAFKEESGEGFKAKQVALIGAGGAARAIAVKIALEGAKKIYIVNRTKSKADEIAGIINNNIMNIAESCGLDEEMNAEIYKKCDIIINTTSIGMYPEVKSSPVSRNICFFSHQIIYDVIYNPQRTQFLEDCGRFGCKVINGLGMLFYQGIYAYEIWTGVKIPEEPLKDLFRSFSNILDK